MTMIDMNQKSKQASQESTSVQVTTRTGSSRSVTRRLRALLSFYHEPWWKLLLWMVTSSAMFMMSLAIAPHISVFLTDRVTWAGLEKWATSSFATATGAVAAAAIAGSAVVATLNQNRRAEANKTWWETFEWAAERAIPSKKENKEQALPFGVSLAILSPLLDDDLAGRHPNKSEQKSWALRKQACESLIGVLREPYEKAILEAEGKSPDGNVEYPLLTTDTPPPPKEVQEAAPVIAENSVELDKPRATHAPTLTHNDVTSMMNFLEAHPDSEQARQLANIHYGALIARSLELFLRMDRTVDEVDRLTVLTKDEDVELHLKRIYPRPSRSPDALIVQGDRTVWVEARNLRRLPADQITNILTKERSQARRLWEAVRIPTLFIHDLARPDEAADGGSFRMVSMGLGLDPDWRRIRQEVQKVIRQL